VFSSADGTTGGGSWTAGGGATAVSCGGGGGGAAVVFVGLGLGFGDAGTVIVVVTVSCGTSGSSVTVTVTTGVGSSQGAPGSMSHPSTCEGSMTIVLMVAPAAEDPVSGAKASRTAPLSPTDIATAENAALRRARVTGVLRAINHEHVKEILVGQK